MASKRKRKRRNVGIWKRRICFLGVAMVWIWQENWVLGPPLTHASQATVVMRAVQEELASLWL